MKTYNSKTKKIEAHPNYVIGELPSKYMSYGITHDKYKGKGHNNKRLESNPKIGETDVAYLRRQLNINDKKNIHLMFILIIKCLKMMMIMLLH